MAVLDYSYNTLDPQTGRLRTFSITTDSRNLALSEIRRTVMKVNHNRLAEGNAKTLAVPQHATQLDANEPRRTAIASAKVSTYA